MAKIRATTRALRLLRPHWPMVAGAYCAMLLSNYVTVRIPRVIQGIIDEGIATNESRAIAVGSATVIGFALIRALLTFLLGRWTEVSSQDVALELRNRLHWKLQSLSFTFHDKSETGQLLSRNVRDVDLIRFLVGRAILRLVEMGSLLIAIGIAMIGVNAQLALPTLTVFPLLATAAFMYGRRIKPLSMKIREQEADLTSFLEENLRGSRIVKAFGRERSEIDRFIRRNEALLSSQRRESLLGSTFPPLMHFVASVGSVIVITYGAIIVVQNSLSIGELVAFTVFVSQLTFPVRRIGLIVPTIAHGASAAERVFALLDTEPEIRADHRARKLTTMKGEIRLRNVSLSYRPGTSILDSVDLKIRPGERVALIGATGSGKSSLVNLIPRFYDPNSGSVMVDGTDVRSLTPRSLRSHIGMVPQETILFATSVRENIAFGRPEATDQQIAESAIAAGAHSFIDELEDGYDTYVGEKGATLSGGQKQRIAIARALLKDPRILILDDATSNVDTEMELQIRAATDRLMTGRTSIVIAHRLSTIQDSDTVVLMHIGRIEAIARRGTDETPHERLLAQSDRYAEIVSRQEKPQALL